MKAGRRDTENARVRAPFGPELSFLFEGKPMTARKGDTVASALFRNGVRVFGRSSKYHRPRGYRCGMGHCSACAMRVDGLPGVRTCVTPVREGMTVTREHAWPGARVDALRAAEALSPLMPPGFYYRWFRRSPRLWGAFERGLARVAGQGELPEREAADRLAAARCEYREGPDVLVVGGGVAGLSAALAASEAGADVLLVERDDRLGGRLGDRLGGRLDDPFDDRRSDPLDDGRRDRPRGAHLNGSCLDDARPNGDSETSADADARTGKAVAGDLIDRVRSHGGLTTLVDAEAIGWYEEGVVAVDRRPDLLLLRPAAVVLATGGYDLGLPFAGWDLPGVMLAPGALRLWERHRVRPGSRAMVITSCDDGHDAAARLAAAGVEIVCVADRRPAHAIRPEARDRVSALGAALVSGAAGARAHGFDRVKTVTLRVPDGAAGDGRTDSTRRFACDLVCIAAGSRPADDVAYQATARGSLVLAPGRPAAVAPEGPTGRGQDAAPEQAPGLWLAGLVAGAATVEVAIAQGTAAGWAAADAARGAPGPA